LNEAFQNLSTPVTLALNLQITVPELPTLYLEDESPHHKISLMRRRWVFLPCIPPVSFALY
jgi:hypothetical protein